MRFSVLGSLLSILILPAFAQAQLLHPCKSHPRAVTMPVSHVAMPVHFATASYATAPVYAATFTPAYSMTHVAAAPVFGYQFLAVGAPAAGGSGAAPLNAGTPPANDIQQLTATLAAMTRQIDSHTSTLADHTARLKALEEWRSRQPNPK